MKQEFTLDDIPENIKDCPILRDKINDYTP